MPSTSTGASLLAAHASAASLLGRAIGDAEHQHQLTRALAHTRLTTIASRMASTWDQAGDNMATTSEGNLLSGADPPVTPMASLDTFEELAHWTADTRFTALIHALLASFSVILVSELGDKTFIITAIMAMKNSRSLVFVSSASALLLMTILSVGMGVAATVIPELYTHYASIVLFLCFGLKMLKESWDMGENEGEESEFEEVKRSLEVEETGGGGALKDRGRDAEVAPDQQARDRKCIKAERWCSKLVETLYIAPIVIKVFTMIFVAEWGDRSQISTVILAAREDSAGVFIGSLSGHVFCTGLAVIGGRFVADMISVRTMTLLGGIIFLFFAAFALLTGPEMG